jgi:hypothetical protein
MFPDSGDEIFIYNAQFVSGVMRIQEEEILAARWVTIDEALALPLAYNIGDYLKFKLM